MSVRPSVCPSVGAVQRSKVFFEANVGVAAEHACHARARAYATHGITPLWMKQRRKQEWWPLI